MTIHREGTATILIGLAGLVAIYLVLKFLLPEAIWLHRVYIVAGFFIFGIILQFFRKPRRKINTDSTHVLAPADGKVVVIEETIETEYFKGARRQISIFMSPLNVHINFNPVSGIVSYFRYHPGKYLVAWHPKSSTDNERSTIVVKHGGGTEILFRQVAGALARRLCWYVKEGQSVMQGTEFGFIKFGSRIDIFLPLDMEISCKIGDKTVGGQTVIAQLG